MPLALHHLSEGDLRGLVSCAQARIEEGSADVPDYEVFVTGLQELDRRAKNPSSARASLHLVIPTPKVLPDFKRP